MLLLQPLMYSPPREVRVRRRRWGHYVKPLNRVAPSVDELIGRLERDLLPRTGWCRRGSTRLVHLREQFQKVGDLERDHLRRAKAKWLQVPRRDLAGPRARPTATARVWGAKLVGV